MGYTDPKFYVERELVIPVSCAAAAVAWSYKPARKIILTSMQATVTTIFDGGAVVKAQVGSTDKAVLTVETAAAIGDLVVGVLETDPNVAAADALELEVTTPATAGVVTVVLRYKEVF